MQGRRRVALNLYRSLRQASREHATHAKERAITLRHLRALVDGTTIGHAPTRKFLRHQLTALEGDDAYSVGGVHADFIVEQIHALFRKHAFFDDPETITLCINDGFAALRALHKSSESLRDMPTLPKSECVTSGLRITAESFPDIRRTVPSVKRFVFNYKIKFHNEGDTQCRLLARHWTFSDGEGLITQEISGPGVVGDYPSLSPGGRYAYQSWVEIGSPRGAMRGYYTMVDEDGNEFQAKVAPLALDSETEMSPQARARNLMAAHANAVSQTGVHLPSSLGVGRPGSVVGGGSIIGGGVVGSATPLANSSGGSTDTSPAASPGTASTTSDSADVSGSTAASASADSGSESNTATSTSSGGAVAATATSTSSSAASSSESEPAVVNAVSDSESDSDATSSTSPAASMPPPPPPPQPTRRPQAPM